MLVPAEMHLMPEEVCMAAAEKLMQAERHFRFDVVHLATVELHLRLEKVHC